MMAGNRVRIVGSWRETQEYVYTQAATFESNKEQKDVAKCLHGYVTK
jgi:hypothetical protein